MFSRTLKKSILDTRITTSNCTLPPTFLLPSRARYFNSTTQHVESPQTSAAEAVTADAVNPKPNSHSPSSETISYSNRQRKSDLNSIAANVASHIARPKVPEPPSLSSTPLDISDSIKEFLPLLIVQPSHYVSVHIHGKPYLVTVGDSVRLPFHMPGVVPGDILRLNRATSIGSRDYTLKGTPYVDERLFECRATVMGTEAEPMRIKEKTKRRNRKVKTVRSKHKYTMLRISELKIKDYEELKTGSTAV